VKKKTIKKRKHVRDRAIRARKTDPSTSHEASKMIEAREGTSAVFTPGSQKHRVLSSYAKQGRPLTDFQAAKYAGLGPRTCGWKRCGECRDAGVIDEVEVKVIDAQTNALVMRNMINELGIKVVARLDAGEVVRLHSGPVAEQLVA
jgi:hypothetical protein